MVDYLSIINLKKQKTKITQNTKMTDSVSWRSKVSHLFKKHANKVKTKYKEGKNPMPKTIGMSSTSATPADNYDINTFLYQTSEGVATSGVLVGRRVHTPIQITRGIDDASPLFMQAALTSKLIKFITVKTTSEGLVNTYVFTNCSIADYAHSELLESFSFVYEKITYTHKNVASSSIMATDDWTAPT